MAGRNAPPFLNTEEDRGAVVAVVSFTAIAVSTFTNSIRLWNRQQSEAALGTDDVLLVAANITAIVQTALVSASITNGLGRHLDALNDSSIAAYHKFSYASNILAILAMALSKFSVLQLQQRLCGIQPASRYIKVMHQALAGSIIVWALFSVSALAFQCGAQNPYAYEPNRCTHGVLWYPVTALNAITDAALAFSFSPVIMTLSVGKRTKVKVIILLGTRLVVCMATIVQISSFAGSLTSTDQTRAMMKPVILQQVVMNLSILTAVVLGLHGFIANLTAGSGFGVEVRDSTNEFSHGTYVRSRQHTGASKASSRPQDSSHARSSHRRLSRVRRDGEGFRPDMIGKNTAWAQHEEWEESGRRSHSSQENIIMQTVSWQVSSDVAASSSSSGHVEQTLPSHEEPQEASARNFVV